MGGVHGMATEFDTELFVCSSLPVFLGFLIFIQLPCVSGLCFFFFVQPPGVMHGVETKWQLSMMQNFVLLESMKERGRHIGVLPNGQLKPALACGRENHAQFGVQLLVRTA